MKTIPEVDLHLGDPCVYCGAAHDDVPVGPCAGARYGRQRYLEGLIDGRKEMKIPSHGGKDTFG